MTTIFPADPGFRRWAEVLRLLNRAFAYMEGRIDPPSSLHQLTLDQMAADAKAGALLLAEEAGDLVGCLFCKPQEPLLYLSKLAVAPDRQGEGIGRALLEAAASEARNRGLAGLELRTRIELLENHTAFAALGFVPLEETCHPGFDRPTSITLRRML